jgi:antitoxin ParD1/3/4
MKSTLNLSLTDELRAFIDENSGEGTLYATPSEFVRDLLRHKKEALDAARIRNGLIEGYQDLAAGRVAPFTGDLTSALFQAPVSTLDEASTDSPSVNIRRGRR